MKALSFPLLLGMSLFALVVAAGDRVDLAKPAPADAIVRIENTRGEVVVTGWDRNQVAVAGELDDLAEGLLFEVDGRHVRIEVRMPRKDVNWGDGSDLRIHVPEGSRVSFEGVSTDLEIKNIRGGSQLRTVSGDIDATDMHERLNVNSVSGDIDLRGATGPASVSSTSGDMSLVLTSTDVMVDTVSGDIELELGLFEKLSVRSVSGEIEIEGQLMPNGRVEMSSVSGDIAFNLGDPVNADVNVRSGIGGDIRNRFNDQKPEDNFPGGQKLDTVVGDGSGRISIRTVAADIRLN